VVAERLRAAAQEYGFEPEEFVDYLLGVLLAAGPAVPAKPQGQEEDYGEVLERLKRLGYA